MDPKNEERFVAALVETVEILREILAALQPSAKTQLGLLDAIPGWLTIYCNRDRCPGALWYVLENGEPTELTAKAVCGYLKDLTFEQVERRGKSVHKLHLFLDCGDRVARLECGHDSVFAKGIMTAIASMSLEQLSQPITVAPSPGSEESVLLSNIFSGGDRVIAGWDSETDWRSVAQQAIANVRALHPQSF
jgi:hypothetical protein